MKPICPACKKPFIPKRKGQKYCCALCQRRAQRKREKKAGKRPAYIRDSNGYNINTPNGRYCRFPCCGVELFGGHWYYCPTHWRVVQEYAEGIGTDYEPIG